MHIKYNKKNLKKIFLESHPNYLILNNFFLKVLCPNAVTSYSVQRLRDQHVKDAHNSYQIQMDKTQISINYLPGEQGFQCVSKNNELCVYMYALVCSQTPWSWMKR